VIIAFDLNKLRSINEWMNEWKSKRGAAHLQISGRRGWELNSIRAFPFLSCRGEIDWVVCVEANGNGKIRDVEKNFHSPHGRTAAFDPSVKKCHLPAHRTVNRRRQYYKIPKVCTVLYCANKQSFSFNRLESHLLLNYNP